MKFVILIPTKDRPNILMKTLDRIYDENYDYIISVEYQDMEKYKLIRKKYPKINYLYIPNNKGLGFARHVLVDSALSKDVDFVWFIDDNVIFKKGTEKKFIETFVKNNSIYWLSGYVPIYNLYLNKLKDILIFKPTLCSSICTLIRTTFLKNENYDVNLKYREDTDLLFRFLLKYPNNKHIFIYKDFIYKKRRHIKGGCTFLKKEKEIKKYVKYINKKYNCEVVSLVYNRGVLDTKTNWKKFFEEVMYIEYKKINEWERDKKQKFILPK